MSNPDIQLPKEEINGQIVSLLSQLIAERVQSELVDVTQIANDQVISAEEPPEDIEMTAVIANEALSDPDVSFTAFLHSLADSFAYASKDETGTVVEYSFNQEMTDLKVTDFEDYIFRNIVSEASKSKDGQELADKMSRISTLPLDEQRKIMFDVHYATLNRAREALVDNECQPIDKAVALLITGYIAANALPSDYTEPIRPPKRKHVSQEDKVFRRAINILEEVKALNKTKAYKTYLAALPPEEFDNDEWTQTRLATIQNADDELLQGNLFLELRYMARSIQERLALPEFSRAAFEKEILDIGKLRDIEAVSSSPSSVPVVETDWPILPPGSLNAALAAGSKAEKRDCAPSVIDMRRREWLEELAESWGNGAYIRQISGFNPEGDGRYFAAILPQIIKGIKVEHVVAESAKTQDNALYLFRAESGQATDGKVLHGSEDVIKGNRANAKQLGARRVLHNDGYELRVIEYLTRPPADLKKRGYRL